MGAHNIDVYGDKKMNGKTQTATFFHYHAQCLFGASEAVTRIRPSNAWAAGQRQSRK